MRKVWNIAQVLLGVGMFIITIRHFTDLSNIGWENVFFLVAAGLILIWNGIKGTTR